ncbi:3-deoxy-manno-octulosonate cytidylyltransferase [Dirofilaria immitis]
MNSFKHLLNSSTVSHLTLHPYVMSHAGNDRFSRCADSIIVNNQVVASIGFNEFRFRFGKEYVLMRVNAIVLRLSSYMARTFGW